MKIARYRWLAGVIAAHPERRLVGRTRLQKEIWFLQRKGMPSDYDFKLHYYGPYSEGVQADINLLERFGMVNETTRPTKDDQLFSSFEASPEAELPEIKPFEKTIGLLEGTNAVVLELGATYDMFRKAKLNHAQALDFLHRKKGEKCAEGREDKALALLQELELPAS